MKWNELSGWLKGGIIFSLIAIIYLVIFFAFGWNGTYMLSPDSCQIQEGFFGGSHPPIWCLLIFGLSRTPHLFTILIWFLYGCLFGEVYEKLKMKKEWNKKHLIIISVLIVAVITFGIYVYHDDKPINPDQIGWGGVKQYDKIAYDNCVKEVLDKVRQYKPASEEPIGAERTDNNGNIWTKQEDGGWKIEEENLYGEWVTEGDSQHPTGNLGLESTTWGDILVDEQIGGAKYTPENFPECEEYLN